MNDLLINGMIEAFWGVHEFTKEKMKNDDPGITTEQSTGYQKAVKGNKNLLLVALFE